MNIVTMELSVSVVACLLLIFTPDSEAKKEDSSSESSESDEYSDSKSESKSPEWVSSEELDRKGLARKTRGGGRHGRYFYNPYYAPAPYYPNYYYNTTRPDTSVGNSPGETTTARPPVYYGAYGYPYAAPVYQQYQPITIAPFNKDSVYYYCGYGVLCYRNKNGQEVTTQVPVTSPPVVNKPQGRRSGRRYHG